MLKFKAQNSSHFSAIDYFTGQTAGHVTLGVPVPIPTLFLRDGVNIVKCCVDCDLSNINSAETRQAKYELKEVKTTFIKK